MREAPEILSNIPLFRGLPKVQLQDLTRIAADKHFAKGQTVFSEGDEGNGFYVVVNGLVKVFKLSINGKEQICYSFFLRINQSPIF